MMENHSPTLRSMASRKNRQARKQCQWEEIQGKAALGSSCPEDLLLCPNTHREKIQDATDSSDSAPDIYRHMKDLCKLRNQD